MSCISLSLLVLIAVVIHCASAFVPSTPTKHSSLHTPSASNGLLPVTKMSTDSSSFDGAEVKETTRDRFRGRNVLLTGASGGLGRAMAIQLSRMGVGTLILSGRDQDALKEVSDECLSLIGNDGAGECPTKVEIIKCDLSKTESVRSLGEESLKFCSPGFVDVLINNGGISSRSSFLETTPEVDELLMQVNFFSGARLAKMLVPGMVEKGDGSVIWVSSVQGLVGIPSRTSYAASKFAVQGYCEALRAELASSGVTVHVASPGYIRTNLSKSAIRGDGSKHGQMDETTANGADPNDVAVTILDSSADGMADFVVASSFSAKAAIWLRLLAPSFLNKMLVKRFDKEKSNS
mmetsp:Transcript_7503/g.10917  ORF Transcript_7503/g.10917 Transcript_7503/m.10917 type:complete len:349 (+) Transcript_7503:65-1111(+)